MKPKSELILYQTEDHRTRIEVRLENETVWLTQKLMAELFQKDVRTINEHIQNIFEERELSPDSVIRKFRITAADGKSYETRHYNLDVIIAVGYRVKSHRGTQFRIWAMQRLREYIVKGFTLDDEWLKEGGTKNEYFNELLQRIREIRGKTTIDGLRSCYNDDSLQPQPVTLEQIRLYFRNHRTSEERRRYRELFRKHIAANLGKVFPFRP